MLFTVSGREIYRVRAARRARAQQLASGTGADWSPDGRSVVLTQYPQTGDAEIHILRPGASASQPITTGSDPTWSRKGVIAFVKSEATRSSVYTVRADGSALRRIVTGDRPDWSPDGERIVFVTARGHIATIGADGRGFNLVTRSRRRDSSPSLSPKGRRIAFIRGTDELWVTGRRGVRPRRILKAPCLKEHGEDDCSLWNTDWQPLPRRRGGR